MYSINVELNTFDQVKNLCNICNEYDETIILSVGRYEVDGKSIMGLMSVGLGETCMVSLLTNSSPLWDEFKMKLSTRL